MTPRRGLLSILLLVCLAVSAFGQASTGSIGGIVTDPAGAAVPGASIEAREQATGRIYKTNSTESGIYAFPAVMVGKYTLTTERAGFKKSLLNDIEVRVALRDTVDIRLEVGEVQQSVEVNATVTQVETTAERGQNISPQFMATLPLYNGGIRSAEAFLGYMPGVNGYGETSINGSIGRAREVEIDGASLTIPESGGTVFNFPGVEAFNEMKLITGQYNAEYGRLGGGLESMVTKSGTNAVHGAAFLNLKRDIFEAAGWSVNQNRANTPGFRPKTRFNEEGGAAGGPVWIPKLYDGRNKSFVYFTYAKNIQPAIPGINSGETTPTPLMKQGNFTEVATTIYDPATTASLNGVNSRQPFAGNLIPQARFSKVASVLLPFIPNPNAPGTTANYQYVQTTVADDYVWTLKLDHAITQNNRIAFFITRENQVSTTDQFWPGPLSNGLQSFQKPDNYRVNHDYVFKPNVLLHTTFGFTRQQQQWDNPLQKGFASKLGFPLKGDSDATPIISFTSDMPSPGGLNNFTTWGMNQGKVANGGQWNWTTHVNQQLSWIRGKHEMKMGWDIRRLRTIGNDLATTNGLYFFNRTQTGDPTRLTSTGHAFASLLLGQVDTASSGALPYTPLGVRYGYHGGFWQDTWRLTSRFTAEFGIRYEVPIGWHEATGSYSMIDLNKPNPGANNLPGALVFAGVGAGRTGQKRFYPTDFSNFGPRGGFAYRIKDKTVMRGGFGIFYQTLGNGGCGCTDGFNGSFSQTSDGLNPAFNWDNGGVKPPAGYKAPPFLDPSFDNFNSYTRMGPNYGKAPRIYNWSYTLQHEYKNFLFEGAYVGNRGHGLNSTIELNQLPVSFLTSVGTLLSRNILDPLVVAAGYKEPFPGFAKGWGGGATLAQALRPYPQYGNISDLNAGAGKSWYDAAQFKVEKRFGDLQMFASYVYSKSLGLLTYRQIFSQTANVQTQDAYNLQDSKSYLPMDLPHVFNMLNSYNLPFGKGKKLFNSAGRAANLAIGGWTIASSHQYRSSGLIQVATPGNPLGPGELFSRITKANVVQGQDIQTGVSRKDLDPNNPNIRWFNSGANSPYTAAPAFTLGNASYYNGNFRNPPFFYENIAIVKTFSFTESIRLVYRADAFNVFNRTDFGGINGTIGNANFGRPGGVQVGPRNITMGLRLMF